MNISTSRSLIFFILISCGCNAIALPPPATRVETYDANGSTRHLFNHSIENVWRHMIDFNSWASDIRFETLASMPINQLQEHQLLKLTNLNSEHAEVLGFIKVTNIEPLQKIVLKAFLPDSTEPNFHAFYVFNFIDIKGKTLVILDVAMEAPRPGKIATAEKLREQNKMYSKIFSDKYEGLYWSNLERLMETN